MLPDIDIGYGEMVDTITVDDLDRQLVQCLGIDGRASFAAIADVLGASDQTIARRYRRLRSAGALRIVGLPAKADGASWLLRMRCVPGSGEAIAAALARRADTAWVQLLSGDTEVLCSLRGDPGEGTDSLLARLPRSGRIVAVTAYSRMHMFIGGPDGLGFLDALPASQVAPLLRPVPGGRPGRARRARRRPVRGARRRRAGIVRRPRRRHRLVGDDRSAAGGPAPRRRGALLRP